MIISELKHTNEKISKMKNVFTINFLVFLYSLPKANSFTNYNLLLSIHSYGRNQKKMKILSKMCEYKIFISHSRFIDARVFFPSRPRGERFNIFEGKDTTE